MLHHFFSTATPASLRRLGAAMALAVGTFSVSALMSSHLRLALFEQAAKSAGGEVVLTSDAPLPRSVAQPLQAQAQQLGWQFTQTLSFPTMLRTEGKAEANTGAKLVALKAVDGAYPLLGRVELVDLNTSKPLVAKSPAPGTAWVDPALATALGLELGQRVLLGDAAFTVAAFIATEPDRGAAMVNLAPRVLISAADLPATGLIGLGSRVNYRTAFAAALPTTATPSEIPATQTTQSTQSTKAAQQLAKFAQQLIDQNGVRGVRVDRLDQAALAGSSESARPEMAQIFARVEQFLGLAALLCMALAALAVGLSAYEFVQHELPSAALLRVLGASRAQVLQRYSARLLAWALAACAAGWLAGWGLYRLLVQHMAQLFGSTGPTVASTSARSVVLGWAEYGSAGFSAVALVFLVLMAAVLPRLWALAAVPPLRVLRSDAQNLTGVQRALAWLTPALILLAVAGVVALSPVPAGMAWGFLLALLALTGAATGAVFGLVKLARVLTKASSAGRGLPAAFSLPPALRLGFEQWQLQLPRRALEVSVLALAFFAAVTVYILRVDLLERFNALNPANTPNRFVVGLQPEQRSAFLALTDGWAAKGWLAPQTRDLLPMMRARLTHINDRALTPEFFAAGRFADSRAKRFAEREFNLSHSPAAPAHNAVVAGSWNAPATAPDALGMSVEQGFAKTMGLKIGDTLSFDAAGLPVNAQITSLREVDWTSMRVNFFTTFTGPTVPELPASWISAFKLEADVPPQAERELLQAFPNVTLIDVGASVLQAKAQLAQITGALQGLLGLVLLGAALVASSVLALARAPMLHDLTLMRSLGASRVQLSRILNSQQLLSAVLAALLACAAAAGLLSWVATSLIQLRWSPSLPLLAVAAVACVLIAWALGAWSLRGVVGSAVLQRLKAA